MAGSPRSRRGLDRERPAQDHPLEVAAAPRDGGGAPVEALGLEAAENATTNPGGAARPEDDEQLVQCSARVRPAVKRQLQRAAVLTDGESQQTILERALITELRRLGFWPPAD